MHHCLTEERDTCKYTDLFYKWKYLNELFEKYKNTREERHQDQFLSSKWDLYLSIIDSTKEELSNYDFQSLVLGEKKLVKGIQILSIYLRSLGIEILEDTDSKDFRKFLPPILHADTAFEMQG